MLVHLSGDLNFLWGGNWIWSESKDEALRLVDVIKEIARCWGRGLVHKGISCLAAPTNVVIVISGISC
jgi:hypothetical protein